MLPEKITYKYDFPLDIKIVKVTEYPLHYHQDVEFVFVLKGEIRLKNGCCIYTLPEGSIFTNNGREVHGLYTTGQDNIIAIIRISNLYFTQHFPDLSRSSYRTYALRENDQRFNQLREMLLAILTSYLKRGISYKQRCIDQTIELIHFLNKNFNLFTFDQNLAVSPDTKNLVLIERMSRIIPYIYEHHAEKITLEELARTEHLSTFYISHMIKTCTGLSFREFLCFARVEFSELYLLQSDKKINTIARDIGFSTTSYYKKYFQLWFGTTPEAHRKKYLPMVKGPSRTERIDPVAINKAMAVVRQSAEALNNQSEQELQVQSLRLDLDIKADQASIASLTPVIELDLTLEDCQRLKSNIHRLLNHFNCRRILLTYKDARELESLSMIKEDLECENLSVSFKAVHTIEKESNYGLDSIANLVHLFRRQLLSDAPYQAKLMDSGPDSVLLQGDFGMLTASGHFKPAYYACLLLSNMSGELIAWGRHFAVVRSGGRYIAAVFNYHETTEALCCRSAGLHEVQDVIRDFNDVLDVNINLSHIKGTYSIKKYSFSNTNTLFHYMAALGFPETYDAAHDFGLNYFTTPKMDVYTETVSNKLHLNFSISGIGLQLAVIEPLSI